MTSATLGTNETASLFVNVLVACVDDDVALMTAAHGEFADFAP